MNTLSWYQRTAAIYDILTLSDWFYTRARADAINTLQIEPASHVFDIFCGTGVNLPLLATRLGEEGRVTAVDGCDSMLARARRRAERVDLGGERSEFRLLDLASDTGSDALAAAVQGVQPRHLLFTLGLSCLPNWRQLLERILSVARSGTRFVVMDGYNPRLTLDARFTNWIGSADVRRKVWQPLAERGADFSWRAYPVIPGLPMQAYVASTTLP